MSAGGREKPVNRVLEHARYRVVVFGRREKQPVRRFDIGVVERNSMDCLDREFCAVGHELRRRTKQRGIE